MARGLTRLWVMNAQIKYDLEAYTTLRVLKITKKDCLHSVLPCNLQFRGGHAVMVKAAKKK